MLTLLIRRFIPPSVLQLYHYLLAHLSAIVYRFPSKKMIVIGVTGTKGKSTTVQFIGQMLEHLGYRVGWTSTVSFKVGSREWVNDKKMTMLGRFQTQKLLRQMVDEGCHYAIVETSSQGIAQFRHVGIDYDIAVFTNLTPEHIEAHGGFEPYKLAKKKLFESLAQSKTKIFEGREVHKAIVANAMSEHAVDFFAPRAAKKYGFFYEPLAGDGTSSFEPSSRRGDVCAELYKDVQRAQTEAPQRRNRPNEKVTFFDPMIVPIKAEQVAFHRSHTNFEIQGLSFTFHPIGRFYFENALAAIATCSALEIDLVAIQSAVQHLQPVAGRLESIDLGQTFGVIVDYAHEPASLQALFETAKLIGYKRLIHVFGSAAGGRDVARRAVLGELSAKKSDIMVVTNEDSYDEDPLSIINQIADAAVRSGKKDGVDLFRMMDRKAGMEKAMQLAKDGDLVLITGKGSEAIMVLAHGKIIPWSDRETAAEAIRKIYGHHQTHPTETA